MQIVKKDTITEKKEFLKVKIEIGSEILYNSRKKSL